MSSGASHGGASDPLGLPGPGSQRRLPWALPSSRCAPAAPCRRRPAASALPPGSPAPWPGWKRTKPTLAGGSRAELWGEAKGASGGDGDLKTCASLDR